MELTENGMKFAVLIDSENISSKYAQVIFDELDKYGFASCRRIYGNWAKSNGWKKETLLEYSLVPIQQFGYTSGKNSTDMVLVIDAMDLLYKGHVDAFCLVTSDSDFTRLAMKLREEGKYVMGMGVSTTPSALKKSCNRFVNLDLIEEASNADSSDENTIEVGGKTTELSEIREVVSEIINEANGPVGMDEIGNRLNKRYTDFDVRNYGYNKFSVFITQEIKNIRVENKNNRIMVYASQMLMQAEVEKAIEEILKSHGGSLDNMSVLKLELEKKYKTFTVKDYGYSRFSSFIKSLHCFEVENNTVRLVKKQQREAKG